VASIALGLATTIVTFQILLGFRETIKDKIFDFASHLVVTKYTMGGTYDDQPINLATDFYQNYEQYEWIDHVQEYALKAGLVKTAEEVQGIILKGVGSDFDSGRFRKFMVSGKFVQFNDSAYSKDVVISKVIADKLKLEAGDDLIIYFIQNPVRYRKLNVSGIYETGLEDFDDKLILGDIGLIRRLNNWPDTLALGFEVFLKSNTDLDQASVRLYDILGFDLYVDNVRDLYIQIFEWLSLLTRNVYIFISLVLFVASFNMISILLILIMERTQMIGVLKSLGATNKQIRKIFQYNGTLITIKGLIWGNVLGIGFGLLQDYFKIIPLDPQNYYMSFVPIEWNFPVILALNALVFVIVNLVLLIPTTIISRIKPIKTIRFE